MHGRTRRVGARSLALLLAMAGCSGGEPPPARGVLERIETSRGLSTRIEPASRVGAMKLGTGSRHAIEAPRFELAIDDRATSLRFSAGWSGAPPRPARFEVTLRDASGPEWRTLGTREIDGSRLAWTDFELPLPAGRSRTLRFETSADATDGRPLFGSVALLGPLPARRPNVLLLSLDTLGAPNLGAFRGPEGISPNIDRFLAESASFERAYAQYGNTLVSHTSIFSALYPRHHGAGSGLLRGPLRTSLVAPLARAGYRTAAFTEGGFASSAYGFAYGFDLYDDGDLGDVIGGSAERTFDRAAEWLEAIDPDDAFFLFVHTYEVHSPYLPRDAEALAFANALTPLDTREIPEAKQSAMLLRRLRRERLSPGDLRRLEALHHAEIRSLDALLAAFLARIGPRLDDAWVVLTSDHGDQFGEWGRVGHGDSLHDRVIHVPLAFRGPGVRPSRIAMPVQLVDVMPTVLDLVGVPLPNAVDGRSVAPLVTEGPDALPPLPAFAEQRKAQRGCPPGMNHCPADRIAVVDDGYKLVDARDRGERRLYDLRADPLETRNVAAEQPETAARLSRLVEDYRTRPSPVEIPDTPGEAVPGPDAATLEQLRALGYDGSAPAPLPDPGP